MADQTQPAVTFTAVIADRLGSYNGEVITPHKSPKGFGSYIRAPDPCLLVIDPSVSPEVARGPLFP